MVWVYRCRKFDLMLTIVRRGFGKKEVFLIELPLINNVSLAKLLYGRESRANLSRIRMQLKKFHHFNISF